MPTWLRNERIDFSLALIIGVVMVPSLIWWKFPMALSGNFHRSLSGGEVKRLSELSTEGAPAVNLP